MPIPDQPHNSYMDAMVQALNLGGKVVKGGDTPSMLGSGYNNKWLVVVPQTEYQPGDDVAFQGNGGIVGHRVTHVKPGHVYTKGTFNSTGDGWIPLKDVYGKIVTPAKQ